MDFKNVQQEIQKVLWNLNWTKDETIDKPLN